MLIKKHETWIYKVDNATTLQLSQSLHEDVKPLSVLVAVPLNVSATWQWGKDGSKCCGIPAADLLCSLLPFLLQEMVEAAGEDERELAAEMAAAFLNENLPEAIFGAPKAGAGQWASLVRLVNPIQGSTLDQVQLEQNEAAFRWAGSGRVHMHPYEGWKRSCWNGMIIL